MTKFGRESGDAAARRSATTKRMGKSRQVRVQASTGRLQRRKTVRFTSGATMIRRSERLILESDGAR